MSVRSRIQAFEALSTPVADSHHPDSLLESPISPAASSLHPIAPFVAPTAGFASDRPSSLAGQVSLIDLKDWIVEDGPVEESQIALHRVAGTSTPIRNSSSSPSGPQPTRPCASTTSPTPLISFQPPPKSRPPLPPRKPSLSTVDRAPAHYSVSAGSEDGAKLRPPGRSNSLTTEHTYPPAAHKFGAARVGHAPASSISSFHSVSLSSDASNAETQSPKISFKPSFEADGGIADFDTASIAESFENVSAPSAASPSTTTPFDWERAIGKSKTSPKLCPPSLPHRPAIKTVPVIPPKPLVRSVSASSSSTATSTKTRRPAPPPPPYQPRSRPSSSRASVVSTSASTSDRSSIVSNATTTSQTSVSTRNSAQLKASMKSMPHLRPTPVPPAARSRYESLFDSAVKGRRREEKRPKKVKSPAPPPPSPLSTNKGRQAAGWRGLSVDLTINQEDHLSSEKEFDQDDNEGEDASPVAPEERLNGRIVKYIWSASRLDHKKLRSIWNDYDPQCIGSIDRDAFVRGMWRIDEELRRAQLAQRTSALAAASSQRIPHRPLPPPRLQSMTTLT